MMVLYFVVISICNEILPNDKTPLDGVEKKLQRAGLRSSADGSCNGCRAMALNCIFAEALCLGISDYQNEQPLPHAAKDATEIADVLKKLGCCKVIRETKQKSLTRQEALKLISEFVDRTKRRIEKPETRSSEPLLVVFYVASHGIHEPGKELPLIVPADLTCSSDTKQLIDLDRLLLQELAQARSPKHNRRPCCVWIIMDTCRSGPITAWQNHSQCKVAVQPMEGYRGGGASLKANRTPNFLFLLACDPGGWAADDHSLSSALVQSLKQPGVSIREACEQAIAALQDEAHGIWSGRQRPWMNQRAGTIFSNIRRQPPEPQTPDQRLYHCDWVQLALARLAGFTMALVVLICFFGLFFFFQIPKAEEVARGGTCPGDSCFCTDCHHRNIYGNDWDPTQDFKCKLWVQGFALTLNRCYIAQLLHVIKITMAFYFSRKPVLRLFGCRRCSATPLDWCVFLVAAVNVLTSIPLQLLAPYHVTFMGYSYGILNFAFIAASVSILILIHDEFPGASQWSREHFSTSSFLLTALIGQGVIFLSRAIASGINSADDAGKQEMLFYACRVFTGAISAGVGFAKSKGSAEAVAKKSSQLLWVSMCWMLVVLAWLLTSHYDRELMAKYHLWRVVAERACNFWKIHLMVWFSEHSIQRARSRNGFVAASRRMRATLVQADQFRSEMAQPP